MKKVLARLHRIEGQVRGLQKALESNSCCESTIMQFKATQSAFDSCFGEFLGDSLSKCIKTKDTKELKKVLKLIVKKSHN